MFIVTPARHLSGPGSVIFAMEEPEIALPPHTQRRMVNFVTKTMGQAIVTSHSPYLIAAQWPALPLLGVVTQHRIRALAVSPRFRCDRGRHEAGLNWRI